MRKTNTRIIAAALAVACVFSIETISLDQTAQNTKSTAQTENPADSQNSRKASLPHDKDQPGDFEAPSVIKMMKKAVQPVGQTLYVWGGGWNEEDTGGGIESVTLGISDQWKSFFDQQSGSYSYLQHEYQIHDGLDCSGYVGWVVYNTLEKENGRESYVVTADKQCELLEKRGLGTVIPSSQVKELHPGDLFNNAGHIYILVHGCEDGSRLILHASPPGVQFSGTPSADGKRDSMAAKEAAQIMSEHYPEYYARYPNTETDASYNSYDQFVWSPDVLPDSQQAGQQNSGELLESIFS
ncbi:MAG: hypothetical protein HUJ54_05795 [Erysipelotrichaceae bacterium]|nr:hypothetical protein [Erysipelotrichaceae bacterium]